MGVVPLRPEFIGLYLVQLEEFKYSCFQTGGMWGVLPTMTINIIYKDCQTNFLSEIDETKHLFLSNDKSIRYTPSFKYEYRLWVVHFRWHLNPAVNWDITRISGKFSSFDKGKRNRLILFLFILIEFLFLNIVDPMNKLAALSNYYQTTRTWDIRFVNTPSCLVGFNTWLKCVGLLNVNNLCLVWMWLSYLVLIFYAELSFVLLREALLSRFL